MATLIDRVGQTTQDQLHRTNSVVVAGNGNLTEVRIAVGIQHGNQGDVELAGFEHRIRLTTLVYQDHNIGKATHVLEATQILCLLYTSDAADEP